MATISLRKRAETATTRSSAQRLLGRDWRMAWLFLLPLTVVLVGLIAYPFVAAIVLSLQHKVVERPGDVGRLEQLPRSPRRSRIQWGIPQIGLGVVRLYCGRDLRQDHARHVHGLAPQ